MATTPKCTTGSVDYIKDVRRNRESRDWDAYVTIIATGETVYLGSRDRSWDAEALCDAYVHTQLASFPVVTDPAPTPTPATTAVAYSPSQHFCCRHCKSDVALDLSQGGELYYFCQNPRCQWAGSVDSPQGLDLKADEVIVGSLDGEPVIAWHHPTERRDDQGQLVESAGVICGLHVTWRGFQVATDGETFINLPESDSGGCGDMTLAQYAWLKAAVQAGVVDRLVQIACRSVDQPWPVAFPPRAHAPLIPAPPPPTSPAPPTLMDRAAAVAARLINTVIDRPTEGLQVVTAAESALASFRRAA